MHSLEEIDFDIDEKSKAILACMVDNPSISMTSISKITQMSVATVKRRVKSMIESGFLIREGNAKSLSQINY